jgi:long-chain acyl-CoA synthetase
MRLTQGIHRAMQLYARQNALVGDGVSLSWGDFAERVARLAGVVRAAGVEPGDRVAMLGAYGIEPGDRVAMLGVNSPRYVEYYFATLWAGAVMVPVNTRWAAPEKAATA